MKLKLQKRGIFQCRRKVFFVMRITLFFILLSSAIAFSANSYSQEAKFSLHLSNSSVGDVLIPYAAPKFGVSVGYRL